MKYCGIVAAYWSLSILLKISLQSIVFDKKILAPDITNQNSLISSILYFTSALLFDIMPYFLISDSQFIHIFTFDLIFEDDEIIDQLQIENIIEDEKIKNEQGDKNLLEGEFANEFKQIK